MEDVASLLLVTIPGNRLRFVRSQHNGSGFLQQGMSMTKVKGIQTDEVLRRVRSGERCSQPIMRDVRKTSAYWSNDLLWHFEDGTAVTRWAVAQLRKRGQIAIAEEPSFRVLKPINKECCRAGANTESR